MYLRTPKTWFCRFTLPYRWDSSSQGAAHGHRKRLCVLTGNSTFRCCEHPLPENAAVPQLLEHGVEKAVVFSVAVAQRWASCTERRDRLS